MSLCCKNHAAAGGLGATWQFTFIARSEVTVWPAILADLSCYYPLTDCADRATAMIVQRVCSHSNLQTVTSSYYWQRPRMSTVVLMNITDRSWSQQLELHTPSLSAQPPAVHPEGSTLSSAKLPRQCSCQLPCTCGCQQPGPLVPVSEFRPAAVSTQCCSNYGAVMCRHPCLSVAGQRVKACIVIW